MSNIDRYKTERYIREFSDYIVLGILATIIIVSMIVVTF